MGCGVSTTLSGVAKVAAGSRESSYDFDSHDGEFRNEFSRDEESCNWVIFGSAKESLQQYVEDRTLKESCSRSHLELRLLLDEPEAFEALLRYAETLSFSDALLCWSEIQAFKLNNLISDDPLVDADRINFKYLDNEAVCRLDFIRDDYIAKVSVALEGLHKLDANFDTRHLIDRDIFNSIQRECFSAVYAIIYQKFRMTHCYKKLVETLKLKYNYCKPSDFLFMEKLGEGAFGLVVHCKKKSTGKHYALSKYLFCGVLII